MNSSVGPNRIQPGAAAAPRRPLGALNVSKGHEVDRRSDQDVWWEIGLPSQRCDSWIFPVDSPKAVSISPASSFPEIQKESLSQPRFK